MNEGTGLQYQQSMTFSPIASQIFSYHLTVGADIPNTAYTHHYDKIIVVIRSAF